MFSNSNALQVYVYGFLYYKLFNFGSKRSSNYLIYTKLKGKNNKNSQKELNFI